MIQETEPITGERREKKKKKGGKTTKEKTGHNKVLNKNSAEQVEKKQREKVLDGNKKGVTLNVGERRER